MDYVLMTPVRNEQDNLPIVARSVVNQTQIPRLWLIVNDGSTDGTEEIIQELESTHSWIASLSLPLSSGGHGLHLAEVFRYGFVQLQSMAQERGIAYDLIGKVDADVFFDASCFPRLIREFEKDESLGIASPRLVYSNILDPEGGPRRMEGPDLALSDHPTDGVRLYRRRCFEEIGGMRSVRACETVAEAAAMMNGWKLHRFVHIYAGISRRVHESSSLWARWMVAGSESHYLGYNPLHVLGRFCFELIFDRPRYRSLAYGWGYIKSCIVRQPRIEDAEIRHYFRYQRPREVARQLPELARKAFAHRERQRCGE